MNSIATVNGEAYPMQQQGFRSAVIICDLVWQLQMVSKLQGSALSAGC
jgi:hypothetical protein